MNVRAFVVSGFYLAVSGFCGKRHNFAVNYNRTNEKKTDKTCDYLILAVHSSHTCGSRSQGNACGTHV